MSELIIDVPEPAQIIVVPSPAEQILIRDIPSPGARGIQGPVGPQGIQGPTGDPFSNIDGGKADSVYGGIVPIDGGGV